MITLLAAIPIAFQLASAAPATPGARAALPASPSPAPASPPAAITVRDARRALRVPVEQVGATPMIRAAALAPILDIEVRREGDAGFRMRVGGAELRGTAGIPFVAVRDSMRQLAAAPVFRGAALYLPLQFVAELLPDAARTGVLWDAAKRELRVFSPGQVQAMAAARREAERRPGRGAERSGAGAADRATAPVRVAARRAGSTARTVVVDAGHGGPDRGMTGPIGGGPRIYEKDITLDVARRIGERLQRAGVRVVYTRTTDTLIALSDRGHIANEAQGDLFLSVHVNAANPAWKSPGGARGFETYFLAEAKTEDAQRVERMENEVVQFETTDAQVRKGDPLSFIVADMLQNEHLRESSELAELIQQRLRQVHPGPSRGVKQAGFRVLVTAFMPSVLVEIGFGTNPAEAAYIASREGQAEIADAVAAAALEYLERYERRVGGGGGE
ncbi:MAG: N-acetylmuramoyl-L-alanine amidase family protein [Gemmatimonadaceae bacterium]